MVALSARAHALQRQLTRLAAQVRHSHHRAAYRSSVQRLSLRIVRLQANLAKLDSLYYDMTTADQQEVTALLNGDQSALGLGRDALLLHKVVLRHGRRATVAVQVSSSTTTLRTATSKLSHKRWNITPSPSPSPADPDRFADPHAFADRDRYPNAHADADPTVTNADAHPDAHRPAVPAGYTLVQNQTINNLNTYRPAQRLLLQRDLHRRQRHAPPCSPSPAPATTSSSTTAPLPPAAAGTA